jgi:hypothetical protein
MPEGDGYTRERNDGMNSGYPSDDKESVLPGFGREFVNKVRLIRELGSGANLIDPGVSFPKNPSPRPTCTSFVINMGDNVKSCYSP